MPGYCGALPYGASLIAMPIPMNTFSITVRDPGRNPLKGAGHV